MTEKEGLDSVDESGMYHQHVLRDQVYAQFDDGTQVRRFDGLAKRADGDYDAIEVKPKSEVTASGQNAKVAQRQFDDQVSTDHQAFATITEHVNGKPVKVRIKIVRARLIVVQGE